MTPPTQRLPRLERRVASELAWWTDPGLESLGVTIAFSERAGGVSVAPFTTLNLAAHVGDEPEAVDENRSRLLTALGVGELRQQLVVPEQVHGERIGSVTREVTGAGAFAGRGTAPVAGTDALVCAERRVPLLMCFADCVPVIIVAPGPAVAIVHAGWRGALASLPGKTAVVLADATGCATVDLTAYVGPHIGPCHYQVSSDILSHFVNTFGTFARADSGGLDLGAVVEASLTGSGVAGCSIASLGACTAEETDRFFSYRAEGGHTGRHCALACIL
ncbi:MAG: laccase domain-containing protein [Actinobacteria bacterium]|nr:MAG: laccase domain-containing protein [Actinomycetota bacterium]